jgi:uncharacterized Zn finger protein (UPF0148 family)
MLKDMNPAAREDQANSIAVVDLKPIAKGPVRRGEHCPQCHAGILDYNGMLDLECPECGYYEGTGGGCT